jgi:hypothetical protein
MDFDIGNLFYIIITLVVVIVGLLGKKKKPAGGTSGSQASKSRPGFFENLEQVLQMGQEQSGIRDPEDYHEDLPEEEPSFAFEAEDPSLAREAEEPTSSYAAGNTAMDLRNRPGIMEEYERIMKQGIDYSMDPFSAEGASSTDALQVIDLDEEYPITNYLEIIRGFDPGTAIVYSAIMDRLDY